MKYFANKIIDYFLPPTCLLCGDIVFDKNGICGYCFSKMNFISKPFCYICGNMLSLHTAISDKDSICNACYYSPPEYKSRRSLFNFYGKGRSLIHHLKYNGREYYADYFADLAYKRYSHDFNNIDLVVPVPSFWLRRLWRGYNQAQTIARVLARKLDRSMVPDMLLKTRYTKSQIYYTREQRKKNLLGSIKFNDRYKHLEKKNILLVDDVYTTGATVNLCCQILKSSKIVKNIYVFTVATLPPSDL